MVLTFEELPFYIGWKLIGNTFMTSKQKEVEVLKFVTYLRMLLFLNNGYSFLRMVGVIKLVVFCQHQKSLYMWTLMGYRGAKNLSFIKHEHLKTFSDWHQFFWLQLLSTPMFLFLANPLPSLSEWRTLWVAPSCNSILKAKLNLNSKSCYLWSIWLVFLRVMQVSLWSVW